MDAVPWSQPMAVPELERLIGLSAGSVQSFSVKRLTDPGQNYGSTLLGLGLILYNGSTLDLAAKFMPPTEFQKKMFCSKVTFLNEVAVYRSINQELVKLQGESDVASEEICDPLPRSYGSRVNAEDDDALGADDGAVILLQNLVVDGYRMGKRTAGLDEVHAEMVISRLARFQATAVALRLLKPDVFSQIVDMEFPFDENTIDKNEQLRSAFMEHIQSFPEFAPYYSKIKAAIERENKVKFQKLSSADLELYTSLTHNDLWVNNIMFRYESPNSHHPVDVKFFDFQTVAYSSPVRDLIFFLYTSVESVSVGNKVDKFITLYYNNFIFWLKKLKCNTADFTKEEFNREIERVAPTEISHILLLLGVVCAGEYEKSPGYGTENYNFFFSSSEFYRRRVLHTLQDFVKRGWL